MDTNMKQELYEMLTEMLADYDFDELISIGCPSDEYSPEAKRITEFVENNLHQLTKDILADNIQVVFIYMLGVLPAISDCYTIAGEILDFIKYY